LRRSCLPKLTEIFGKDLLDDPAQYDGFALLTATGGDNHSSASARSRSARGDPPDLAALGVAGASLVRRLVDEVLAARDLSDDEIAALFALSDDYDIPEALIGSVREVLGA